METFVARATVDTSVDTPNDVSAREARNTDAILSTDTFGARSHFQTRYAVALPAKDVHITWELASPHPTIHFDWHKSALVSTSARLCWSCLVNDYYILLPE